MVKRQLTHQQLLSTLGRNIFFFNHIKTNQTLYSLTRTLNNNEALKQCFFMGPGSVPRSLRKDLWTPLLSVHLPTPQLGLKIFHHLRELKMLHLTQWKDEEILKKNMDDRRAALMNQKANSIADLSAALKYEMERHKDLPPKSIVIRWQEQNDLQFAESWPKGVFHDTAGRGRHTSASKEPELQKVINEVLGIKEEPIVEEVAAVDEAAMEAPKEEVKEARA